MPDGTSRFSLDGKPLFHYMGTSTFANYTVVPEIAVAKIREDAPFDKVCYIGCGVTTGVGAVINTAKVEAGDNVVVFGLGGIGLNVIQGRAMVGADKIIGVDLNPARKAMAEKFGMTHFVNPKPRSRATSSPTSSTSPTAAPTTASSASATSRSCARRWSAATRAGAAASSSAWPGGRRRSARARSSWSPAASGRARPSAAPRAAPTCPRSSTGTWTARSTSTT
jgi:Zn-dependent alcohol dehydrogenase